MKWTDYGIMTARGETRFYSEATGAMRHVEACAYDTGLNIVLTGRDINGVRFRKTAKSIFGAYAVAEACKGIRRAWLVTPSGRKLIFTI